jgi:signal transduction histidine kinase
VIDLTEMLDSEPEAAPAAGEHGDAIEPMATTAIAPKVLPEEDSRAENPLDPPRSTLRQLADAVAHEVLNPLTSIRTFAQLLPTRFADEEFRTRFAEIVEGDVMRATRVANRLSAFAALGAPHREPVDATGLLEQLLEARRKRIRERDLLVLTELDHDRPLVLADTFQLRFALEAVLDQALELVPTRGDLFVASQHHEQHHLGSSLRILVRCETAQTGDLDTSGVSPARHSLGLAMAEWVVAALGGSFALDSAESGWLVIVLDLPAP